MKFYISDLHLGHKNIIKFDNRPFDNTKDMEDKIISNWNSVVKEDDEVYILGDMFWKNGEAERILSELKGEKYLLLGNHDKIIPEMKKYFVWCDKEVAYILDNNTSLVLSHYPIAHWKNQPRTIHLYGHIHKGRDYIPFEKYSLIYRKETGFEFMAANVGCMIDYMNYTPRTLNEIIKAKGW